MQTKMFKGTVQLDVGMQEVIVQADTWGNARAMLEAQYGKASVFGVSEVREEPAERGVAAENRGFAAENSVRWSRGDWLAFALGIAAFCLLYKLGAGWTWSTGIAVAVWLGAILVQAITSDR